MWIILTPFYFIIIFCSAAHAAPQGGKSCQNWQTISPAPTTDRAIASLLFLCCSASIFWLPTGNLASVSLTELSELFVECILEAVCASSRYILCPAWSLLSHGWSRLDRFVMVNIKFVYSYIWVNFHAFLMPFIVESLNWVIVHRVSLFGGTLFVAFWPSLKASYTVCCIKPVSIHRYFIRIYTIIITNTVTSNFFKKVFNLVKTFLMWQTTPRWCSIIGT